MLRAKTAIAIGLGFYGCSFFWGGISEAKPDLFLLGLGMLFGAMLLAFHPKTEKAPSNN